MNRTLSLLGLIFFFSFAVLAQNDFSTNEPPVQKAKRMQWWREGRFGMFIHWGPVSLEGTEISWSRGGVRRGIENSSMPAGQIPTDVYDNLYKKFNPIKFDSKQWVNIAKSAGMKYMVLVAKHCDGFCMWDSKVDDYDISHTPFKKDICKELADAAHKNGMRIGWYYSPMDWRDSYCRTDSNEIYVKKMQGHLRELLSNYGRVDLLWFDSEGGPCPWHQKETYNLIRDLQPQLVINDRLWIGKFDDKNPYIPNPPADYKTPEQRVGAFENKIPWETCMTLGTQWSWKPKDKIKTYDECIRILVQCVTGDGNLLLNVGPMPDGRIEPRQVKVLEQIGKWLNKYGESIYETRGGPFKNGTWGGSTYKKNIVYLHIAQWEGNKLILPPINAKIIKSTVLTGGKANVKQTSEGIIVNMRRQYHNSFDTIIKLKLDRSADDMEPLDVFISGRLDSSSTSISLKDFPSSPFDAHDAKILMDGVHGTTDRLDGKWLGFEEKNFEAVFDLGSQKKIHKAIVGCLQEQVSSIFYPKSISILISENGKEFRTAGKMDTNQPNEDAEIKRKNYTIDFQPASVRFVKVIVQNIQTCPSWNQNSGKKAWLLLDEINIQ